MVAGIPTDRGKGEPRRVWEGRRVMLQGPLQEKAGVNFGVCVHHPSEAKHTPHAGPQQIHGLSTIVSSRLRKS